MNAKKIVCPLHRQNLVQISVALDFYLDTLYCRPDSKFQKRFGSGYRRTNSSITVSRASLPVDPPGSTDSLPAAMLESRLEVLAVLRFFATPLTPKITEFK